MSGGRSCKEAVGEGGAGEGEEMSRVRGGGDAVGEEITCCRRALRLGMSRGGEGELGREGNAVGDRGRIGSGTWMGVGASDGIGG